ncbi:MAG: hypothetical protein KDK36_14665 [Leptospiraceae bacterium]|nr:hypothetical protein [Leptospiraceae bacterium]
MDLPYIENEKVEIIFSEPTKIRILDKTAIPKDSCIRYYDTAIKKLGWKEIERKINNSPEDKIKYEKDKKELVLEVFDYKNERRIMLFLFDR